MRIGSWIRPRPARPRIQQDTAPIPDSHVPKHRVVRCLQQPACGLRPICRSISPVERVTGIGGVFQRAGQAASLRSWYAEHLGIDLSEWGMKQFEWTAGGSTTWALFDHDTEYFGRPEQAFMVNFRVADLDAMLAQLRAAGVEVADAVEESEFGRFGWAVDPEGTRFELWEPPAGS